MAEKKPIDEILEAFKLMRERDYLDASRLRYELKKALADPHNYTPKEDNFGLPWPFRFLTPLAKWLGQWIWRILWPIRLAIRPIRSGILFVSGKAGIKSRAERLVDRADKSKYPNWSQVKRTIIRLIKPGPERKAVIKILITTGYAQAGFPIHAFKHLQLDASLAAGLMNFSFGSDVSAWPNTTSSAVDIAGVYRVYMQSHRASGTRCRVFVLFKRDHPRRLIEFKPYEMTDKFSVRTGVSIQSTSRVTHILSDQFDLPEVIQSLNDLEYAFDGLERLELDPSEQRSNVSKKNRDHDLVFYNIATEVHGLKGEFMHNGNIGYVEGYRLRGDDLDPIRLNVVRDFDDSDLNNLSERDRLIVRNLKNKVAALPDPVSTMTGGGEWG